jgi:hypothetical protein
VFVFVFGVCVGVGVCFCFCFCFWLFVIWGFMIYYDYDLFAALFRMRRDLPWHATFKSPKEASMSIMSTTNNMLACGDKLACYVLCAFGNASSTQATCLEASSY